MIGAHAFSGLIPSVVVSIAGVGVVAWSAKEIRHYENIRLDKVIPKMNLKLTY